MAGGFGEASRGTRSRRNWACLVDLSFLESCGRFLL
jgi:hypothetical protein